jgi:cyclophilin family peptidyl-prolyl cis-trans isomerase
MVKDSIIEFKSLIPSCLMLLVVSLLLGAAACTGGSEEKNYLEDPTVKNQEEEAMSDENANTLNWETDENGLSKIYVEVETEKGPFKFRFYPEKAPKTSNRIANLVQKGFYDGLTFHRVEPGFVVQGGDPTGTGRGGSGENLKAEFNDIPHVRGTMAMARTQDPDSADSQFYVSLGRHPHLDGQYTVFGRVVEGMESVEKIKKGDKMTSVKLVTGTEDKAQSQSSSENSPEEMEQQASKQDA